MALQKNETSRREGQREPVTEGKGAESSGRVHNQAEKGY